MDAWFEEDEQVFVHPRDPYTRVDTLHSSRHVRVEIDGVTMGETRRPMLLFEIGLPTRYYIPKLDVRMDLLEPSESTAARIKESRTTGRLGWATSSSRTSCGVIRRQFPSARRSKTCSASTTSASTCTSMGCCKIDQSRHSLNVEIGEVTSRRARTCIEGRTDFVGLRHRLAPPASPRHRSGMTLNPRLRQHGRRARRRRRSAFSASR
jgi:hypothetical protein